MNTKYQYIARICALCAVIPVYSPLIDATASLTLTNNSAINLEAAVQRGGTVVLGFDGTVEFTHPIAVETNITLDATGHMISLDARQLGRHFNVTSNVTLRLVNLTLRNGRHLGESGHFSENLIELEDGRPGMGGSIYSDGGAVELIGCTFAENEALGGEGAIETSAGASYGGAIYSEDGEVRAVNCLFTRNRSIGGKGVAALGGYTGRGGDALGGALYSVNSRVTLAGVTFWTNIVEGGAISDGRAWRGGGSAYGGAVCDAISLTLVSNGVFVGNEALSGTRVTFDANDLSGLASGGAVFHGAGTMELLDSFFSQSRAQGGFGKNREDQPWLGGPGNGGGIFNEGMLELRNCAVVLNQANGGAMPTSGISGAQAGDGRGGGIYNSETLLLMNCTIAGNSANGGDGSQGTHTALGGAGFGGGIYNHRGLATLLNVTVASNSNHVGFLGDTGLIGSSIAVTDGVVALTNVILASWTPQINVSGRIHDGGHNICSDHTAGLLSPTSHSSEDPLLGPLAMNGGSTPTMALLPASPAINSADNLVCPATDQRGFRRPQGGACDIGAFELDSKLSLHRDKDGRITVNYLFQASQINSVKVSADLVVWTPLGTSVADTNGLSRWEDVDATTLPMRFYKIDPQREE